MIGFRKTNDLDLLKVLHKKAFPGEYVRDFYKDVTWIISSGKNTVGFCSVIALEDEPGVVFLSRCGIFKSGIGLHREAIKRRVQWARNNGYKKAITYVDKANFKSIANLIRCGFHMYTPDFAYCGSDDYFYFIKNL